jgi:acyl transferase domain-containing protein
MNTRMGGFISSIDQFDRDFFALTAVEAAMMDPQQHHVLETCVEAHEDAGLPLDALNEKAVGVSLATSGTVDSYA